MTAPRSLSRALTATGLALALIAGSAATSATASHFRASGPDFAVVGDDATWTLETAWEKNDASSFVGLGGSVDVLSISDWGDTPGAGAATGTALTVTAETYDESNPLYSSTTEVLTGSLAALPDGKYELYVSSCCRVGDIVNSGTADFSQWVRFEKAAGAYALAPNLTTAVLYAPLPLSGATTTISYAASNGVTWTPVFDTGSPFYGSGDLPCSQLSGGTLSVGSALCTGGDVWADLYTEGSFWATKIRILDAAGRDSVAETLFRVESLPDPYIDAHEFTGNGTSASFSVIAPDTVVTTWQVDCTNVADDADVVTGTSAASPVVLDGFAVGATYDCMVSATNGAGTGTSTSGYQVGPVELAGVLLTLDLQVGQVFRDQVARIQGGGLDVASTYTLTMSSDPIELYRGTTDEFGAFDEEVVIPAEACVSGTHQLSLSALADGAAVTDDVWFELDDSCVVLQVSQTGPVAATPVAPEAPAAPELAETGAFDMLWFAFTALALMVGGLALRRRARV